MTREQTRHIKRVNLTKKKKERKKRKEKKTSISRLTKLYGVYVKNGVINVNVGYNKMTVKLSTTSPSERF